MERWNKLLAALMVVALAAGLFIAGSLVSSSTGAAPPDAAQSLMAQASAEEQDIRVQVDGRYLSFDVPPMIENGRTLVPLRALFEALGAEVQWDGETQTVSAVKGDVTVRLTIGSNVAYVNDRPVTLDVPARIVRGRTLVPVRFVSEALGAQVAWNAANRVVSVTTPAGEVKVQVDGKYLTFDVPPMIEQGRTLVPLRALFEALGAQVEWDGETQTVTAVKGDVTVRLTIGSNVAYVNDRPVTLDVPARIVRGRTLVPLRFVSEALGAQVAWDAAARLVSVVTGAGAAPAKEAEKPTEEVAEKPTTTPTTRGGGGGGAAPAAQEKVLWLGAVTSFDPFNPLVNSELRRINYSGFTHVGLVKFDANNNIVPCLAERWEVLDGGKTIRFHLVRNVKWHDGQPVTARDVKFNYEYKIRHGVGGDTYYFRRYLDSIQVEDDHTVTIRFKQSAVRPILIEMAMAYVIPEHVWSKVDNPKGYTGQDAWVGCGPFVFESYDRAASTAYFKRNDEYFAGRPYVTRIAYKNYATYDALVMALKKGEIDATFGGYAKPVPASYAPALVDTENVRLGVTEYLGTLMTLVFNVKTELFKEKQFREAVAYAIDYDKLRQMFAMGYGQIPGRGFTPPCVPGFDATIPKLEYNKERAQSLLDSLGWVDTDNDGWRNLPGKGNIAFSITPEAFAGKEYLIDAIAVICEMLKEVGIYACLDREVVGNEDKIDARIFSDKDYWAYVGYCTPLGVLADGGAVYLAAPNPQTGTPGDGTCDDPEYLAARDRALFAPTLDEAARALKEVQEYQARELPGLALIWGKVLYPYRTDRFTGWVMQEGWGPVNYNTWFSLKPL